MHRLLRRRCYAHRPGTAVPGAWGLLKLGTFGLAGTMGYFGSLGNPPAIGIAVIAAEILGGLALIAGLGVRWVSLALVPLMLGALVRHAGNGWVFASPGGGWEFPVFRTMALLAQAGLGAGAFALRGDRPTIAARLLNA